MTTKQEQETSQTQTKFQTQIHSQLQEQLKKFCTPQSDIPPLPWKQILQLSQLTIHFLLSAILTSALFLGDVAPLGVALVGASGGGLCGAAALTGACLGYLFFHSFSQGLRYVSSCIITFALWFCFYDLRPLRKPWVIAVLTTTVNALTTFVYLNHGGWTPTEVAFYLAEFFLTLLATWSFNVTLLPLRLDTPNLDKLPPPIPTTLFTCAILVTLSNILLWDDVSLGRILSVILILAFSWKQGKGTGAILGLTIGLALDFAQYGQPLYAMSWGFSAMCSGFFQHKSRFHSSLAFLLATGVTAIWTLDESSSFAILYEGFIGTSLFLLLPRFWFDLLDLPNTNQDPEQTIEIQKIQAVKQQLQDSAYVFHTLGETLKTAFRPPSNQNDVAIIFDRTANKVCQKCYQCHSCWEKDYVTTYNAMNDATPHILARGKALPEDFPPYFAYRCLHFPQYIEEINLQLTSMLYRRQYNNRVRESRVAVCEQYKQLAQLLATASTQISEEITPQIKKSKKLNTYLASLGLETKTTLQTNAQNLLSGEIIGENTQVLETPQGLEELAQILQVPITLHRQDTVLHLRQLEPYMALTGFAVSHKENEQVCGDQNITFKREDGKMFLILCDGMGSGEAAQAESSLATELLQQFLTAGIETLQALSILSSALALRGEDEGGFTTVDLLEIDLITAQATLYKYGAAPSYFKRGNEIKRIIGSSLPAGADFGEKSLPDQIKFHLKPDDTLLLISDGVTENHGEDNWLCTMLQQFQGKSVGEFAKSILAQTPPAKDDRTVLSVKLINRPPISSFTSSHDIDNP